MQNTSLKIGKPETPVLHITSAAYTGITFLNEWVFDVISCLTQLSQDFKVSNGRPINNKIQNLKTQNLKLQNLKLGSLSVYLT